MTPPALALQAAPAPARRRLYLSLLAWAFACTNGVRVLTYLLNMWSIHDRGQSDQHSLLAWCGCMAANLTMAAWLHEQNGRRFSCAVGVNAVNGALCGVLALVILWYR